jgi:hypothetical protein
MTRNGFHPREQGDLGEASAIDWLTAQGWHVYLPVGHSPDCDLLIRTTGHGLRVQVKTCAVHRLNRWDVSVCTRGGNQSWSGTTKYLEPEAYDYHYVHCGDGRRWFIPSSAVEARAGLRLGGPKYLAYEIEPGRPLPRYVQQVSEDDHEPARIPST